MKRCGSIHGRGTRFPHCPYQDPLLQYNTKPDPRLQRQPPTERPFLLLPKRNQLSLACEQKRNNHAYSP